MKVLQVEKFIEQEKEDIKKIGNLLRGLAAKTIPLAKYVNYFPGRVPGVKRSEVEPEEAAVMDWLVMEHPNFISKGYHLRYTHVVWFLLKEGTQLPTSGRILEADTALPMLL
mgnify:CR=1 FL=1